MNAVDLIKQIKDEAPSIKVDGKTYYVVERDRKVESGQLLRYAESIVGIANGAVSPAESERLVVATELDGRKMRWRLPVKLTWAFDEVSFAELPPEWLKLAKKICQQATGDWNKAAKEQKIAGKISFAPAAAGKKPVFKFAYNDFADDPNTVALAFFPNDPPKERFVYLGPATFSESLEYDKVGIVRHELGHVLGFRHEHIRPESQEGMTDDQKAKMEKWVTGKIGAEELTKFDGQSVMHYPLNNLGTMNFELTALDKKGFGLLYSMKSNPAELKEYPV